MAGIAPVQLLGIMQEVGRDGRSPETHPDGVPEIAAATGYPDDDDLAQAIIFAEATEQGPFDPDELGTTILG